MKNVNEYKKRFYNLMESEMGDVRPLIVEETENNYWEDIKNEFINKGNPVLINSKEIKSLNWGTHSSKKNNLKYGMSVSWTPDTNELGFIFALVDRDEFFNNLNPEEKKKAVNVRDNVFSDIKSFGNELGYTDEYGESEKDGVKYRSFRVDGPNDKKTYQDIVKLLNAGLETSLD